MVNIRRSEDRGIGERSWLSSRHTFSFAGYHDPNFMGFRSLRVLNEDVVAPGMGFGTHPHRDMEIISYVVSGALQHRDSLGSGSVLRPGEIQRMSAGTGITHSEFNASDDAPVHFLQIWITPFETNIEPSYEQIRVAHPSLPGDLHLIASQSGGNGVVKIHQDVAIYAGIFERGHTAYYRRARGRHLWLHVVRGTLAVNGDVLSRGDAAYTSDSESLHLSDADGAEVLLFDLC